MDKDIIIDVTSDMVVSGDKDFLLPALNFDSNEDDVDAERISQGMSDIEWPMDSIDDPLFNMGISKGISGPVYSSFADTGTVERGQSSSNGKLGEANIHVGRFDPPADGRKGKVIPAENVVVDEDNKKILVIPPRMHCKWHTQLHKSSNGTQWVLVFHINHGQIGHTQVEIMGNPDPKKFKGRRYKIPGAVKKIHKEKDKIVVVLEKNGKPRILIYDIEHNTGRIKWKDSNGKWHVKGFSL